MLTQGLQRVLYCLVVGLSDVTRALLRFWFIVPSTRVFYDDRAPFSFDIGSEYIGIANGVEVHRHSVMYELS